MPTLLHDWLAPFAASGPGWLGLAFLLGLVHALDADHVMAISVFATRGHGAGSSASENAVAAIRAGLRWSLGHGLVLLLVGLALVAFGRALPASIASLADRAVGVVMIGLGFFVFRELGRHGAHLHLHAHDGLRPHAHWHGHARSRAVAATDAPLNAVAPAGANHRHEHGALFVGALHGLAGSAPILALLPVAQQSPRLAIAQLVVFGLGVAAAMVVVGGLLGRVALRLAWLRSVGAAGSVAIGVSLVLGA
jgi:nickel/cobalt exporter